MKIPKLFFISIVALIIIILFLKLVIPFYYVLFANINIVEIGNCQNVINITTDELEKIPASGKVVNGKACRNGLCVVSQEDWNQIKNFINNKRINNPNGECFKFEKYDGFYSISYNRP